MAVASSLLQISPERITATPGAPLSFEIAAINETRSIKYLEIRLIGLEGASIATDPSHIEIPPEGEASIGVTVDVSFVTPGDTSFGFELTDMYTGELFAYGDVDLQVDDISTARLEMPLAHISGLTNETTDVTITNAGATPLAFVMHATAPDESLGFEFDPPRFTVQPGEALTTELTVRRKTQWFGAPNAHVFDVYAYGSSKALSVAGQFRQVAVFPPLLFKIIGVVVLAIVAVVALLRVGSRLIDDQEPFEWEELATAPDNFQGRYGHTSVWVEFEPADRPVGLGALWNSVVGFLLGHDDQVEAMIVWGGASDDGDALASGAMYTVSTKTWSSITDANNPPAPRAGHGAVWTGDHMVIWGGQTNDGSTPASYGAQFSPERSEWTSLPFENQPSVRRGHSTTWTGSELIVFGGESFEGRPLADGAILHPDRTTGDLADGAWEPLPTFPGDARSFHSASWTGEYLVVFGGFIATGESPAFARDAYAYDVARNRWWDITLSTAPSGRACHRSIFTGEETLFLGGVSIDDVTRAITANDLYAVDPGFQGLCGIPVATASLDPTAWSLVMKEGSEPVSPPEFEWTQLPDAPRRLANRFSMIWTGQEATVVLPIEELDTVGTVRYLPEEGFEALPLPASDVYGFHTNFTTVWINGGMIVFGGRDFDGAATSSGALLITPDR